MNRAMGPLLILLCAGILIAQVLVRPAVGIVDNGDFPKVAGPFALAPAHGTWDSHRFHDFVYQYIWAEHYRYRSGFWSSELWFLKLARGVQRLLRPGPRFDIRWLGSVHGLVLLLGVGLWTSALPRRWKLWSGLWTILVLTDVVYVQYLNSMYMDAAALICLAVVGGAGLCAVRERDRLRFAFLTAAAALLFAASKTQHALPALVFIPLFAGLAFASRKRGVRAVWLSGSVLLTLAAATFTYQTPDYYKNIAVFDLVFLRLAPDAAKPSAALHELGLSDAELPYLGMYTFLPNAPIQDPAWAKQFQQRCDYSKILRFYLRHPSTTVHMLYRTLSEEAPQMEEYANRSLDDGFPKDSRDTRFAYWSRLRAWLLKHAPWHILLIVLAVSGASVWLWLRSLEDRPLAGLALTFQALAGAEYGIAVLADAVETARHLLLFHAATDISILLLPLLIARIYAVRCGRASASTG